VRGGLLALVLAACTDPASTSVDTDSDADSDAAPWDFTCPEDLVREVVATVDDPRIAETSGLVASRRATGRWWVHNDSGDQSKLYAIDEDGLVTAEVLIDGVVAADWEDMAWRTGADGAHELWVGDIGDNAEARAFVTLIGIEEPDPDGGNRTVAPTSVRTLRYGDDRAHDAEALFADPQTGRLYVVTKERTADTVGVFEVPADGPEAPDGPEVMPLVASLDPTQPPLVAARLVTAGDVSADGRFIALRTYTQILVYPRPPGTTIPEAFAEVPCAYTPEPEPQGEALGFGPQGDLYSLSEATGQPVWRYLWPL